MGKRRQAREATLKLLYALEMSQPEMQEVVRTTWSMAVVPEAVRDFTMALVTGVVAHRATIDALIQTSSVHWSLERIGLIERNILRFAIYELLYMADIPPKVTINEAVEVAKRYGAEEASVFVNGILDRIQHEVPPVPQEGAATVPWVLPPWPAKGHSDW
ncbi:Transcription antitermination protein NusB [Candidatus Entotheonellaceae bacterium PAL068K]